MPHIEPEEKKQLKADSFLAKKGGHAVYLVTLDLINTWKVKPSFQTWFDMTMPLEVLKLVNRTAQKLPADFTGDMVKNAVERALDQFFVEVVLPYEVTKSDKNGNVYEEEGALDFLKGEGK